MNPFTLHAPAKINLALHVLGRRENGYHDLDTIVAFAGVGDTLTFSAADAFSITAEGPFAAALPSSGENIISKAYDKVSAFAAAKGKLLPPIAVHLVKNLPVASGIGGGSADAAAAMRGFLRIAGITALDDTIMAAALSLGADVPVCLAGKPCRVRGIGERITAITDFEPRHAILVNPRVEVSTPEVFRQLGLEKGQGFGEAIADEADPSCWRNDLAAPAIAIAPVIADVIARLQKLPGVTRAFMSGSGATCVALHGGERTELGLDPHWWTAQTILS